MACADADPGGTTVAITVLASTPGGAGADATAHQVGWTGTGGVGAGRCRAVAGAAAADPRGSPVAIAPLAGNPVGAPADTTVDFSVQAARSQVAGLIATQGGVDNS